MGFSKEFLEKNLDYKIESFEESEGSNLGDNFATILKCVKIKPKHRPEVHLAAKVLPIHLGRVEFIEKTNFFWKELNFYNWWIPKLINLQRNLGIEHPIKLTTPPFLFGFAENCIDKEFAEPKKDENGAYIMTSGNRDEDDTSHCIFMTDVRKTMGYKLGNKMTGLSLDETKLVVEELAKLHALGWAYKYINGIEKMTDLYPHFKDTMNVIKKSEMYKNFQLVAMKKMVDLIEPTIKAMKNGENALKAAIEMAKKIPDIEPCYTEVEGIDERKLEGHLRIKPEKPLTDENAAPWLVICHGDSWLNNFMFKYNKEGQVEKAMLVDFQIVREACPTTDLAYFMYLSTTHTLRKNHENEILQTYHDKFAETCALLQVPLLPGFNMESLQRKYRRAKLFGYLNAVTILQIILKPSEEALDLDQIKTTDVEEFTDAFFANQKNPNLALKQRMIGIIMELYEDGVI